MCACGCFLVVAIAAALIYCVMHGLWFLAAVVLLASAALGWLARKTMQSPKPK